MPHHKRRDSAQVQQLLQRAHLNATQAHVKLDLKESRITILESDKLIKDAQLVQLETDRLAKETQLLQLETDKTLKDTTMAALTARLVTLENGGGSSSGDGSMSSETVNWTNISEINLSGEKIANGDFSSVTGGVPTNWVLQNGTLDADQLALGRVDGLNGAVALQQMFSSPLAIGTKIIVKVERYDTNTGNAGFRLVKADGNMHGNVVQIPPSPGFVEYTVADHAMAGIRLDTLHGTRSLSSISVFQGAISGGSVQVYAGGTIEKISGSAAYNAGASSVQAIGGNSDGYVQFQLSQSPIRVGLTYSDVDFADINPFRLVLNYNGSAWVGATKVLTAGSVSVGDFFRIRHYSADNTVHFQKRQAVYADDTDFCLLQTCGLMPNNGHANDHTFETENRPLIKAKQTLNGLTAGEYYRIHIVNTNSGNARIYTTAGVQIGWMSGRGTNWEIQKEEGQEYVTFHTHPTLTNGNDLYVDTSLFNVGSRLNDVTIVR